MATERSPRTLRAGAAFYLLAAAADSAMTLYGMRGDLSLEGNPVMRAAMERLGPASGLALEKLAVGAACVGLAYFLEPQIRRRAAWIEQVPATPWAQAWYKRKDRSWIAFLPLYGVAALQGLGAAGWAWLLWGPRP